MRVLEKQSLFAFLSLIVVACQPSLSPAAEMFDLSELSGSQQSKLWTQVGNWAVAVVLANFCKQPTSLEERMTRVAVGCITSNTIKTVLDRFHAKMDSVKGKIWDCTDKTVKTFVEKTVAKAGLLVERAEKACSNKLIYQGLLPFLQ
jgi:hypothetical protein